MVSMSEERKRMEGRGEDSKRTRLYYLEDGESARVVSIESGERLKERMEIMNIRPGKIIKKMYSQPFSGPIVVEVDGSRYAIGRGIAMKIIVEKQIKDR